MLLRTRQPILCILYSIHPINMLDDDPKGPDSVSKHFILMEKTFSKVKCMHFLDPMLCVDIYAGV